jgi:hypothetical protein
LAPDTQAADTQAALAAHADWSVDPRKRWVTIARRAGGGWTLAAPQLVGDVDTFLSRLIAQGDGGAVALGADLPIGLPRAFAANRPEAGFRAFLGSLNRMPAFFKVCGNLAEIGPDRPFYPARGLAGMTRLSHALALGLADAAALCRACDRATASCPCWRQGLSHWPKPIRPRPCATWASASSAASAAKPIAPPPPARC